LFTINFIVAGFGVLSVYTLMFMITLFYKITNFETALG